ncbi:MAG: hypothetical protein DRP57_01465 [Spirochaetes bacterium]|nr:MAG: hypothetical protein DRP57_01465 [Spirochaetota bacterium]
MIKKNIFITFILFVLLARGFTNGNEEKKKSSETKTSWKNRRRITEKRIRIKKVMQMLSSSRQRNRVTGHGHFM